MLLCVLSGPDTLLDTLRERPSSRQSCGEPWIGLGFATGLERGRLGRDGRQGVPPVGLDRVTDRGQRVLHE